MAFLQDDDSDDDFSRAEPAPKRRMLEKSPCLEVESVPPERSEAHKHRENAGPEQALSKVGGFAADQDELPELEVLDEVVTLVQEPVDEFADIDSMPLPAFLSKRMGKSSEIIMSSGKSVQYSSDENQQL